MIAIYYIYYVQLICSATSTGWSVGGGRGGKGWAKGVGVWGRGVSGSGVGG